MTSISKFDVLMAQKQIEHSVYLCYKRVKRDIERLCEGNKELNAQDIDVIAYNYANNRGTPYTEKDYWNSLNSAIIKYLRCEGNYE